MTQGDGVNASFKVTQIPHPLVAIISYFAGRGNRVSLQSLCGFSYIKRRLYGI